MYIEAEKLKDFIKRKRVENEAEAPSSAFGVYHANGYDEAMYEVLREVEKLTQEEPPVETLAYAIADMVCEDCTRPKGCESDHCPVRALVDIFEKKREQEGYYEKV